MTEERKQALIDWCNWRIGKGKNTLLADASYEAAVVALAALTASPGLVLRPFGEGSQNTFVKCESNHPLAMKLFTRPAPAADIVPGEWTNEQCLEFLSIALRHAEISGDIEMDDIRLAVKMVNAAAPEVE